MIDKILEVLAAILLINTPATVMQPAERIDPPEPQIIIPVGLQGREFAPIGLSDCDEMNFYRVQWGLPEKFNSIGWRESNCRNEDIVKTYCCYGYWQMYIYLFLKDHRMIPLLIKCEVDSHEDINSDEPLDKQRQACAAKALYDVEGLSPWALTI